MEIKYKTYPAYKDSGVEWLGEIPEEWEAKRLGTQFTERKTKVSDKDFPPLSVTKQGILPQLENAAKSNDGDNRKLVKEGDFVINSRSDRKGSSGIANENGSVSLINIVMKPKNFKRAYTNYLLKSNSFIEEFYRNGHGIVADLWTTRYDEMKNIKIPIPPIPEQTAIASFLDHKTELIDKAISNKEKLIELLKERKQIIIQNAVTGKVVWSEKAQKMIPISQSKIKSKDSGVEWIGEIPEGWEVKKIKYVAGNFMYGTSIDCNELSSGTPVLRIPNIGDLYINFSGLKYASLSKEETKKYTLTKNDILIVRTNGNPALVGKSSMFVGDGEFMFASYLIRMKPKSNIKPQFLLHAMNSFSVRGSLTNSARTSAGNYNLNTQALGDCYLTYPSINEQAQIVSYIETQSTKIDLAIALQQTQIEKLKEYKATLIDSAVTGKVKVS